jgi:hypothetical protein
MYFSPPSFVFRREDRRTLFDLRRSTSLFVDLRNIYFLPFAEHSANDRFDETIIAEFSVKKSCEEKIDERSRRNANEGVLHKKSILTHFFCIFFYEKKK